MANMEEHEPRDVKTSPDDNKEYRPTTAEEALLKKVNKMLEKSKKHREKYDKHWMDNYQMFRGNQWKEERPPYRHSEVFNMIFQNIQAVIPIMTDKKPKFEFLPQGAEDFEVVSILNELAKDDWDRNNWLMTIVEMLYDSHIYGTAFSHTGYDPEARDGLGSITFESKEPLYCYPDPEAMDVNVDNRYFIEAKPMSLTKIKRLWPTKGKFVKSDIDDFAKEAKVDVSKIRFKSPTENVVSFESNALQSTDSSDMALVLYAWFKDDKTVTEKTKKEGEEGEEEGEEEVEVTKIENPKGKRVVIANGVVLQNGPNPFDDGEFPYEKLLNYVLPREFWGESEVEQLKGPQIIFNKMVSFALDTLTLMGNPIWILDTNSGIDATNLFNSPGLIVEKTPGSEVRRESGTQLQPYVLQLIDRVKLWFDDLSGINEVSRGAAPGGVSAASAIGQLQDASQQRIRQKSRNLDMTLQKVGQHYLSRAFQFYTAPRVIRLTNEQSATKYFKVSIDIEKDDDGTLKQRDMIVVPFTEDAKGRVNEGEQMRFDIIRNFDVRVQTGSGLPFARAEKEAKLLQLFDRGLIDAEEVLKNSDLPNWEAILKRVTEKQAAQQQQEQQQQ